jgi:hypothetical protein
VLWVCCCRWKLCTGGGGAAIAVADELVLQVLRRGAGEARARTCDRSWRGDGDAADGGSNGVAWDGTACGSVRSVVATLRARARAEHMRQRLTEAMSAGECELRGGKSCCAIAKQLLKCAGAGSGVVLGAGLGPLRHRACGQRHERGQRMQCGCRNDGVLWLNVGAGDAAAA